MERCLTVPVHYRLTAAWAALAIVLSAPTVGQAAPLRERAAHEYDLKAAFLFNFTQFVEWPAADFPDSTAPIIIGVLGEDPFGRSLDAIVAGESIRNHPLAVRRFRSIDQVDTCHVLFISSSEASRLDRIFKALGRRSILTVGETKDFADRAGMIGFEVLERHLHLRINVEAARDARLIISSKLLRQAKIVGAGSSQ